MTIIKQNFAKTLLPALTAVTLMLLSGIDAKAAELKLVNADGGTVTAVQSFENVEFTLLLDQKADSINAVQGRIILPERLLKITAIDISASSIDYWTITPKIAKIRLADSLYLEIQFSGTIFNGYEGQAAKIFTIKGTAAPQAGEDDLIIEEAKIFLNDGSGNQAAAITRPHKLNVNLANTDQRQAKYAQEQNLIKQEKIVAEAVFNSINKCEFIVMDGRANKWDLKAEWTIYKDRSASQYFKDINEAGADWCAPYADYAFDQNIIAGRNDEIFGLEGAMTRYEAAVIIARQIAKEYKLEVLKNKKTHFLDDNEIADWARAAVFFLNQQNIFTGFDLLNGQFRFGGQEPISKANAAIVLYRAFLTKR